MSDKTPEYPGYQLVPFNEITDEARKIAVAWCDGFEPDLGIHIEQRHKLASDIMNYANAQLKSRDELLERAVKICNAYRRWEDTDIDQWLEDYTKIKKP